MVDCLKIAICDDDALSIGVVSGAVNGLIEKKNVAADVSTFRSAHELEQAMLHTAFDLIFMDINLPDANGIDFGAKLRAAGSKTHIIFVSGNENSVFDSFKCEPIGFVRKSRFLKDLVSCFELFMKKREDERGSNAKTVSVKCKKRILLISVDDIVYIEGALKQQRIFVVGSDEEYVMSSSMKKLEEELAPHGFIRIHSGYLVNYRFIKIINKTEVKLKDGRCLPVSRGQMKALRERFLELKINL